MNYSFLDDNINEHFISLNTSSNIDLLSPLARELQVQQPPPQQNQQQCPYQIQSQNQFNNINGPNQMPPLMQRPMHMNTNAQMKNIPPPKPTLSWNNSVSNKKTPKDNKYYFQTPYQKYFELIKQFGAPSAINSTAGGIAVWDETKSNSLEVYTRLEILDEQVYNKYPIPHVGFIYAYYKIAIPIYKLANVLSISNDIKYDIINKLLIVRGMSLAYCNTLIAITIKYVRGDYSWHYIRDNELVKNELLLKNLQNESQKRENISLLKENRIN